MLSKLSTKVPLPSNRVAESYLEFGYNKCDNPDCKYWNSVQPVIGHYNCKGFIPKPDATGTENGSNQHRAAAGGELDVSKWSDDSDDEASASQQRCPGTYTVSAKQAYVASHLFCAAGSEHCKRARAKLKQDKAARKAAREARSKAAKLAKEVEKEFKRDLMEREVRKKKEWLEDLRKEKDRWLTKAEEKQDVQQPAEPVKRLKRETRRLPITIRKAVSGDTADSESSTIASHADTDETIDSLPQTPPQSAPPTPNLRRRGTPPRPRPKGVVWDESSITPPRVAQYPLISRSPNKLGTSKPASPNTSLNTSTSSLPDISPISPLFEKYRNKNGNESNGLVGARSSPGLGAAYTRSYRTRRPQRVSYKNGVVITHFGTLMPTATRVDRKSGDGGEKKPQSKTKVVGRQWQGQRRYLVLSKVDVL